MQGEEWAKEDDMSLNRGLPYRWATSSEMIPEQTFSIRYNFRANP
jgi:hypothetical protein